MGTQLYQESDVNFHYELIRYTFAKRYIMLRFHPRKIVFDLVGTIWGAYFLWTNNGIAALFSIIIFSGLGVIMVRKVDPHFMAQTTLGKLALIHFHPFNLGLQILGLLPLIYGLWMHVPEAILIGVSLIIVGHFYGWSQLNDNF